MVWRRGSTLRHTLLLVHGIEHSSRLLLDAVGRGGRAGGMYTGIRTVTRTVEQYAAPVTSMGFDIFQSLQQHELKWIHSYRNLQPRRPVLRLLGQPIMRVSFIRIASCFSLSLSLAYVRITYQETII
jgi:hypothetical protein